MSGNNMSHQQQGMIISQTLQYNAPYYAPQHFMCFGTCPSGTMKATMGRIPGYLEFGYIIPAARQRSYHPNPTVLHSCARRVAFLPDTADGRNVILRFQYAFLNGLCFTVGRSRGSGLDNQVTWSDMLSHKTGTTMGPQCFSFPDPAYLPAVSLALDRLCIPRDPQVCRQWIEQNQGFLALAAQMGGGGLGTMRGSAPTPTTRVWRAMLNRRSTLSQIDTLYYDADSSSSIGNTTDRYSKFLEPVLICKEAGKEDECSICLDNMVPTSDANSTKVICIKKCRHRFHKDCLMSMFDLHHTRCPNCREPIDLEPHGQGPSGTMKIVINRSSRCEGFENDSDGVIELHYKMQGGIQLAFMENPGQHYSETSRTAYLPHNECGRKLLARLKYAFTHGLTFRVGTSVTTGRSNQITWTSIHHKTSFRHGAHGYPDPRYFSNCNTSLDALRVPKAEDCT